jgi:hypothetical protein
MASKKLIEAIKTAQWRTSDLEGPHEYSVDKGDPHYFMRLQFKSALMDTEEHSTMKNTDTSTSANTGTGK